MIKKKDNIGKITIIIFIIILLCLITFLLLNYSNNRSNEKNKLDKSLIKLNISWELKNSYEIISEERTSESIKIKSEYYKDKLFIKIIFNISENASSKYIEDQRYMLDSLFEDHQSPYPGDISYRIICQKEYYPSYETDIIDNSTRFYYFLFANDRFTYGGCNNDFIKYESMIAYVYCNDSLNFYKIEYFTPKENPTQGYKEMIKSFRCGH